MTERKRQSIAEATQIWELGLLRFLYDKGIITEDEFFGIRRIAEEQYEMNKGVS